MKKPDLIKQFNLPGYIKGKTASEAARMIENKFKEKTDSISIKTRDEFLERLKMAQEFVKEQNGLNKPTPNEFGIGGLEDQFNTDFGTDTGALASGISSDSSGVGKGAGGSGIGGMAGGIAGVGGTALELFDLAQGIDEIDITKQDPNDVKIDGVGNIAGGAVKGAAAGAKFGPWGALAGGVIGAGAGVMGTIAGKKEKNEADRQYVGRKSNIANNQYAMGGSPCGGPGQPPCPPLGAEDMTKLNSDPNAQLKFTDSPEGIAAMNTLFKAPPSVERASVDLGKYKDVNYFDFDKSDPTGTTLVRGSGQKYNDEAVKRQLRSIREGNPGIDVKYNNNYAMGGGIDDTAMMQNRYAGGGGIFNKSKGLYQPGIEFEDPFERSISGNSKGLYQPGFEADAPLTRAPMYQGPKKGDQLKNYLKEVDYGSLASSAARLAPAIGNIIQSANAKPADAVRLNRIDSRYSPNYADEAAAESRIDNVTGNLTEAIQNASNGSTGALRSNLLAAYLKKGQLKGEAAQQAAGVNRAEDTKAFQSGREADVANLRQANLEQQMNDANQGAYATEKSRMAGAIADDVGNIGLEGTRMAYAKKMGLLYDSNGKYIGRMDKASGKFIPASVEAEPTK